MQKKILIRFGEIFLKGKNKRFFTNLLFNNIKHALSGLNLTFTAIQSRYIVENYSDNIEQKIIDRLKKVAGIFSLSVCYFDSATMENIRAMAILCAKKTGTFRVTTNRADKTFPLSSIEISKQIGGDVLQYNDKLVVDLTNPSFVINIDVRENKTAFVYSDVIDGIKGMPVGCAGKGLLLLSGGIDSPAAGFMMLKRGMVIDAIHYHSFPYTSEKAKEKVIELAEILAGFGIRLNLHIVPFTEIQTAIHKHCSAEYMVTLMRRFMMRIADRVAISVGAGALITGESLGQVASQTLEGITASEDAVTIPVFRPLIAMDKEEITVIARKIGTFQTSILPYEDCCTIFLPENPIIKPRLKEVKVQEEKLDIETLITTAINGIELIKIER